MKDYTICNQADKEIFRRQCAALENNVPGIKKGEFLHDVDDTMIQFYRIGAHGVVEVRNDEDIGYVGIKTNIDLESYFKK